MSAAVIHARKRDRGGQLVGVPMCGARTQRTDEDRKVTCGRCLGMLSGAPLKGVRS